MRSITEACGGGDGDARPLVAGTLRGYRTWRPTLKVMPVPTGHLPLTAVSRRHVVWTPTLTAECRRWDDDTRLGPTTLDCHPAPARECQCGVYGWYRPDDTAALRAPVFGVIEASGVVLLGTRGFRAQRARVLAVATGNRRIAEQCAAQGVAVYRRPRELLRDFPPDDVTELLGVDAEPAVTGGVLDRREHRLAALALAALVAAVVILLGVTHPMAVTLLTLGAIGPLFALTVLTLR